MIGQLVGHYRILELIGTGGMGEVFRAHDERLGRDVALKLIRPASSDNPDHLRRFEQEARAAAALNHPNILAIYDVGFEGTTPYIVSELLEGKTLRQRLQEGAIPLNEASGYALQIAHGLTAAHDRHIVHRDLKPENLFLTKDDRVKILDFGVAKLQIPAEDLRSVESLTTVTKTGAVIGTVAYMSPEQLRGKPVDYRSDIFSFGAILYEMLSGSRAFRGETQVDTMTAVLREEPAEANLDEAAIPAGYQDIVRHCLEKDPDDRFQSAKDLAFALQTLAGGSPLRPSSVAKPRRTSSALPWALVSVLVVATAILALTQLLRTPPAPPKYRRLTSEAGTVYAARFAADGQSIVYGAAWNNKSTQLFSTVGNSLLAQPLNLSDANLLAIAPNNELALVMKGTHSGQLETVDGVLARAPLAGGSPRQVLSDVRWADWNPQGQLAVVHYVDGKSRLEFPIGNVLYQSPGWISNIRFSPRGDQIAFMDHPAHWDYRGSVCVVDLSGHVRVLSHEWESESGLAWRPDGKEIWFSAAEKGSNLNVMAVSLSGKLRVLLDLPTALHLEDIASDGRALVSLNSTRLAMGFSTLGSTQRADIDLSSHDWNIARDISRDGQSVLFEDASEAVGPGYVVAVRKVDGALPAQLGEGSAGSLSPDGQWAVTVSTGPAPQLTLLPVNAGQPRSIRVTGLQHIQNGYARFLPNGKTVTVNGDEATHGSRCYVVDLATGAAKAVTLEGFMCGASSPDGRSLIGRGPNQSYAVYSLEGGPPRPLTNLSPTLEPVQWSNDGAWFYGYHVGEFPSNIYKVNIATGKEILLQELKPGVPAGVVRVAPVVVSRDGARFAYSYNQTLSVLYIISGLQ
jgi:eukaryotic-like serine/threonine-protein kinase